MPSFWDPHEWKTSQMSSSQWPGGNEAALLGVDRFVGVGCAKSWRISWKTLWWCGATPPEGNHYHDDMQWWAILRFFLVANSFCICTPFSSFEHIYGTILVSFYQMLWEPLTDSWEQSLYPFQSVLSLVQFVLMMSRHVEALECDNGFEGDHGQVGYGGFHKIGQMDGYEGKSY